MESFQEWLDFVLDMPLPDDSAAVNFQFYSEQEEKNLNQSNSQVQEALIHRMMTSKEIFVTREALSG